VPDFDAIADALAARFAPGQLTAPTGYLTIRVATAKTPNQLPPLPCVLVFPDAGTFETGNGTRIGHHTFLVRFYYSQIGDFARDVEACRDWLTVLADQLRASVQLSGTVTRASLDSWKIGQFGYGGNEYSGIEFGIGIVTTEGWAAVA
jgi:hypothetical protein